MRVDVLLFARLREVAGTNRLTVDVPPGTTASQLAGDVIARHGDDSVAGLPLRFAVDETFVPDDHPLRDGDCVAILPPMSGG